jgi:hypothetical protein
MEKKKMKMTRAKRIVSRIPGQEKNGGKGRKKCCARYNMMI